MTDAAARRLISFVGTGGYTPATYRFGDGAEAVTVDTPYVVEALARVWQPTEIVLCVTPTSRQANGLAIAERLHTLGYPAPELREIPESVEPSSIWPLFQILKDALAMPAPGAVALDITHGWRATSFFAGAVIAFLRGLQAAAAGDLQVYYGAYQKESISPIWDLTRFVDLLDWSQDLSVFLQTGRATGLASRTASSGFAAIDAWKSSAQQGPPPALKDLGVKLGAFSEQFETVRVGELLCPPRGEHSAAAKLLMQIDRARADVAAVLPPLAETLDHLRALIEPLVTRSLHGHDGQKALVALAGMYLSFGRYVEAAAVIREGWVTLYGDGGLAPGPDFDRELRHLAERHWYLAGGGSDKNAAVHRARNVRNDLQHAGFNRDPKPPAVIRSELVALLDAYRKAERQGLPRVERPVFVNLSNHPLADWSDRQIAAALAMDERFGPDALVDLPFPAVPAQAGDDLIDGLVAKTLKALPDGTTHAMVMGEFTTTMRLVRELQKVNVVCVAACGDRQILCQDGPDKTSRFDFVRFRQYPS